MAEITLPGTAGSRTVTISDKNLIPTSSITTGAEKGQGKPARPEVKKVVKGVAKKTKPSLGKRLKETFFGDEVVDVKGYLLYDVLVPSIKDLLSDMGHSAIDIIFFGRASGRRRAPDPRNSSRVSYGSRYDEVRGRGREPSKAGRNPRYAGDDIYLESREDAIRVLSDMTDIIQDCGCVRVADLYTMVGITPEFTDEYWGWTSIEGATYRRVRGGDYILELPKAINVRGM